MSSVKNTRQSIIEFIILTSVTSLYIFLCPFNKVEESFNTHAIYDIVNKFPNSLPYKYTGGYEARHLNQTWDHVIFPGVVPRTFVGALLVGLMLKIPKTVIAYESNENQFSVQILSRVLLAILSSLSLVYLFSSVQKKLGFTVRKFLFILSIFQFHYLYYASRFLPNTYAAILTNLIIAFWIDRKYSISLTLIACTVIIFRFDTCLFFGMIILDALIFSKHLSFWKLLRVGIPAGLIAISVTILIDSFFWQTLVWPEFSSVYFNVWLNKSHEWGTQPYWWYFYSCLPRMMLASLPLLILTPRDVFLHILVPTCTFISLLSWLPHKELRFLLFIVPVLNICCASALVRISDKIKMSFPGKHQLHRYLVGSLLFLIVSFNAVLCVLLLAISRANYPGGDAGLFLSAETKTISLHQTVGVYINNLASQTGFSNFLQNDVTLYSKAPNITTNFIHNYQTSYIILEPHEIRQFCGQLVNGTSCQLASDENYVCNVIKNINSFSYLNKNHEEILDFKPRKFKDILKNIINMKLALQIIKCLKISD